MVIVSMDPACLTQEQNRRLVTGTEDYPRDERRCMASSHVSHPHNGLNKIKFDPELGSRSTENVRVGLLQRGRPTFTSTEH